MEVADLLAYYGELKSIHTTWEATWQTLEDLCFPAPDSFLSFSLPYGNSSANDSIDRMSDLGISCTERAASGIFSNLLSGRFFKAKGKDGKHDDYFAKLTDKTLVALVEGNFFEESLNFLKDFLALGTATDYTEFDKESRQIVTQIPDLSTVFIDQDWKGLVVTVMREVEMSAIDAVNFFGETKVHSSIATKATKAGTKRSKSKYLQAVMRNDEYDAENPLSFQYNSYWIDIENNVIVKESGYFSRPFQVARFSRRKSEAYGRGAGHQCLNSLLRVVHLSEMISSIADRFGNPPWLSDVNSEVVSVSNDAGKIIEWDSSQGGQPPTRLEERSDPSLWINVRDEHKKDVEDAFFLGFLQMLSQIPETGRTKYELQQRVREKMDMLIAPLRKLRSEWLEPKISRVVELLLREGLIEPLPEGVTSYDIILTGRLAQFLEDVESGNIEDVIVTITEMREAWPEVADLIDVDKATRALIERVPLPAGVVREESEVIKIREARAQAQAEAQQEEAKQVQAQQLMDAYQKGGKAPEDGSMAAELGQMGTEMMNAQQQ